jgi:trk system potassium uptake protein TrkH
LLFDFRPILVVNGYVLLILAAAMVVPLAVDWAVQGGEWRAFLLAIAAASFAGAILVFAARGDGAAPPRLRNREAFLATASAWTVAGAFACLPFLLGSLRLHLVDSLFEAISGLTTTGATVIVGLDRAPASLLLWRALLNWLGGIGIILTAVAVLPVLRIGGMQQFRLDSSEPGESAIPRLSRQNRGLLIVYPLLTAILAIAFALTGMNGLESLCHAMSALSTGGFSTSDQSLGHFGDGARWVAVIGMIAGAITFSLYVAPLRQALAALLADSQVRRFLIVVLVFAALLTAWNWGSGRMDGSQAVQRSVFNTVSILTTTGFHWGDYDSWGGFAPVAFFFMALIGGCTGSAAGGIKMFRFEVLFAAAAIHLKRLLHPHGMFTIEFNKRRISEPVVRSVVSFVMLYLISIALLALALAVAGLDVTTSLSGAAAAIGNVGPGLGPLIGPGGGYHGLAAAAKWLLIGGMIAGRLELATVIVLFTRTFWRS